MSDAEAQDDESEDKARHKKEKRPRRERRGLEVTLYVLIKLLIDWWLNNH